MDRTRALLDGFMESQPSVGSPLSALGLGHMDGPDLLQEKLEGRQASAPPSEAERTPEPRRSADFHDLNETLRTAVREAKQEPEPPTPSSQQEDKQEPAETEKPSESKDPEFEGFHVLNDQAQMTRDELAKLRQEQQQMSRWMQQQYAFQQQEHASQQPAIEEQLYQEFGLSDPAVLRAYGDHIKQQVRAEQQQVYQQQVLPVLMQQQRDRMELSIARQKDALPHFEKYFNSGALKQLQEQLMQSHGVNAVAAINWDAELQKAYQTQDYPRLKAEYEKLEKGNKKSAESTDARKAEQKAKLSQVPKASREGGDSVPSFKKDIDALPASLSMRSFGREALRILARKQA